MMYIRQDRKDERVRTVTGKGKGSRQIKLIGTAGSKTEEGSRGQCSRKSKKIEEDGERCKAQDDEHNSRNSRKNKTYYNSFAFLLLRKCPCPCNLI